MQPLLSIENLSVDFVNEQQTTNAVKNISFQVNRGEILAIVGESGSGKSQGKDRKDPGSALITLRAEGRRVRTVVQGRNREGVDRSGTSSRDRW